MGRGGGKGPFILLSFLPSGLTVVSKKMGVRIRDQRPASLLGLHSWVEEGGGMEAFSGKCFRSHLPSRSLGYSVRSLAAR